MMLPKSLQAVRTASPGRSLTLPVRLSYKTAEELWSEIQRCEQVEHNHDKHGGSSGRQLTSQKVTVEDFLIEAGFIHNLNGIYD